MPLRLYGPSWGPALRALPTTTCQHLTKLKISYDDNDDYYTFDHFTSLPLQQMVNLTILHLNNMVGRDGTISCAELRRLLYLLPVTLQELKCHVWDWDFEAVRDGLATQNRLTSGVIETDEQDARLEGDRGN
ncbi:hypothetical protein HDV00_002512 [Rhizophlyctis rosea]|nr:hypothetical protein HDV00_002512 [Rhizophlyctis rosea]